MSIQKPIEMVGIQERLYIEWHYLVKIHKIPYNSVSVIHREQDLGFHCIFLKSVEHLVTDTIKKSLESAGFGYSFVNDTKA